MDNSPEGKVFDFVIIGSGFGGSVSAMRLAQKGYSVLILEQGKRFRDQDFARSTWQLSKYLWIPALRCFGILQISPFKDLIALHGTGVGGGSLGYANVLMKPSDRLFDHPSWRDLADWKTVLAPHYRTAERMLGSVDNPRFWRSDEILREIASEMGTEATFRPTRVGVFFGEGGEEGSQSEDPYFAGDGPARLSCIQCGACMVGCCHNAKNTLEKNYLYFAEKWGAEIWPESRVRDVRPLTEDWQEGARYQVIFHRTTAWITASSDSVRARNVVFSAGALGTQRLLFRIRDITHSLPLISSRLGSRVRTNNESLLGSVSREKGADYSKGIAITSFVHVDDVTAMEPVRYPAGSSFMRLLSAPLIESSDVPLLRLFAILGKILIHPLDFLRTHVLPGWAQHTTILLAMQTDDNHLHMRLGRSIWTLFRQNLISDVSADHKIPSMIPLGHQVTRKFALRSNGVPAGSLNEGLLNTSMTAHILGGCPIGRDVGEGVIGQDFQVFNYPGLYVIDGSVMPANPGVNPSLTITALAEYAMSGIPQKPGSAVRTLEFSTP